MDKVLIAYEGAAAEAVAWRLRAAFGAAGLLAEARPAAHVARLSAYGPVVLGSDVPGSDVLGSDAGARGWSGEALEFLRSFQDELARRPFWVYTIGAGGSFPALALRLRPRAAAVFDPAASPETVTAWAEGVVRALLPVHPETGVGGPR